MRSYWSFAVSSAESGRLGIKLVGEEGIGNAGAHLNCFVNEHSPPFSRSMLYR